MNAPKVLYGLLLMCLLFGNIIANPIPDDDDDTNNGGGSDDEDSEESAEPKCISPGDVFDPVNLVAEEVLETYKTNTTNSNDSNPNNDTNINWRKLVVNKYYGVFRDRFFVKNTDGLIAIQLREGDPYSWATLYGMEDDWRNEYIFARAHLFYSQSKDHGSMHSIWGSTYALEIQYVHYKKSFDSLAEATKEKHGVLVICILFGSTGKQTPYMDPLVAATVMSAFPQEKYHVAHGPLDLQALLPDDLTNLQYTGQYIMPPCAKEAKFLVLINEMAVAEKQLGKFREVRDHEAKRTDGIFGNFMAESPKKGIDAKVSRNIRFFVDKSAVAVSLNASIFVILIVRFGTLCLKFITYNS